MPFTRQRRRQEPAEDARRRQAPAERRVPGAEAEPSASDDDASDEDEAETQAAPRPGADTAEADEGTASSRQLKQLTKSMVRYVLSCEYARIPIRRDGVKEKVLGSHGRLFSKVSEQAQKELRDVFGFELVELPAKEKHTEEERRDAIKRATQPTNSHVNTSSTRAWILVSCLPEECRRPDILAPSQTGASNGSKQSDAESEPAYIGFTTIVISLIMLSGGGELSDRSLKRYLARLQLVDAADEDDSNGNGIASSRDKTKASEAALARMVKHGYIEKAVQRNGRGGGGSGEGRGPEAAEDDGQDAVSWFLGPRGKTELGPEAVAQVVRGLYAGSSDSGSGQPQGQVPPDIERRIRLSLGLAMGDGNEAEGAMEDGNEDGDEPAD